MFGLLSIYHAKKLEAKLLYFAGMMVFFTGGFYLGASIDFLTVLLTENNIPNGLHGILSFMWVAPAVITAMYLGSYLMIPSKKWYIVSLYLTLAVVFEFFLFIDPLSAFNFEIPPGRTLIDSSFVYGSITFILIVVFLASALIFTGVGFLIKSIQSTGAVRKRFAFLSIGFIVFVICGALDSLVAPGLGLIIVRGGMICYAWFMYFGLKTA